MSVIGFILYLVLLQLGPQPRVFEPQGVGVIGYRLKVAQEYSGRLDGVLDLNLGFLCKALDKDFMQPPDNIINGYLGALAALGGKLAYLSLNISIG